MSLISPTQIGDASPNPSASGFTYIPDQLIAGDQHIVTQPITLQTSAGLLPRGSVLGQKTNYTIEVANDGAGANGANTGNGTIGSLSGGSAAIFGAWVIKFTDATHFTVTDPEGVAHAAGVAGTPYADAGINFEFTAGGVAMVAGDGFILTQTDNVGEFILSVRTASDGSQNPVCLLVDDTDASAGPVNAGGYFTGEFNQRAISYDNSWTVQQLATALRATNIHLKSSISAADPTTP